jgi:pyruvate,water dikinase
MSKNPNKINGNEKDYSELKNQTNKTEKPVYVRFFDQISKDDVSEFGGKNANLGELVQNGLPVPFGFATLVKAYDAILDYYGNRKDYFGDGNKISLKEYIKKELIGIDKELKSEKTEAIQIVDQIVAKIRNKIETAGYDPEVKKQIIDAYRKFEEITGGSTYAVRSSATAEDLPDASFAGQQDSHMNIFREEMVLGYILKDMASVFTTRATQYRQRVGYDHFNVKLSVGVQEMAGGKSGVAAAGVAFSMHPDSGNKNFVTIRGGWGLGDLIVQGKEIGDEYLVFKESTFGPTLVSRTLVDKRKMEIFDTLGTKIIDVPEEKRKQFVLSKKQAEELARHVVTISELYGDNRDVEWVLGNNGKLYIVQARAETVESRKGDVEKIFYLLEDTDDLVKEGKKLYDKGIPVGRAIASGPTNYVPSVDEAHKLSKGDILLTLETDPDWTSYMQHLNGVVTEKGGPTCHAAIVTRELELAGIVGADGFADAYKKWAVTDEAKTYMDEKGRVQITIDCSQGKAYIWKGEVAYGFDTIDFGKLPRPRTKIQTNLGIKEGALSNGKYPDGSGLIREEFIITDEIQIHPNFLLNYEKHEKEYEDNLDKIRRIEKLKGSQLAETDKLVVDTKRLKEAIDKVEEITEGHGDDKIEFYVNKLAEGIATIAGSVWKRLYDGSIAEAVVRMSDFKTNEYKNLVGGWLYEPDERNPMIGFRGASRYVQPEFEQAFRLECRAIKRARDWGLTNIVPMIPFCRTTEEAKEVQKIMAEEGLIREEVVQYVKDKEDWDRGKIFKGATKTVKPGEEPGEVKKAIFDAIEMAMNSKVENGEGLKVYVMAEIPENIFIADKYCELFDGFSIGSNDLTQLIKGVDRDNEKLASMAGQFEYGPNTESVKRAIKMLIDTAHSFKIGGVEYRRTVGICGQAPSDYPEFLQFLVQTGIDKISLNPDTFARGRINAWRTEVIEENLDSVDKKKQVYELVNRYDSAINEIRIPAGKMRFIKKKLDDKKEKDKKLAEIVQRFDDYNVGLLAGVEELIQMVRKRDTEFGDLMKEHKNILGMTKQRDYLLEYAYERWKEEKKAKA